MKKIIFPAIVILAIVSILFLNSTDSSPKIIERSVMMGDYVVDTRSPEEACGGITQEVQDSNSGLKCRLIDSDVPEDSSECIDGASIAGCFTCTFECK
jgi:hypothetical protein